jgi:hypothetical protein
MKGQMKSTPRVAIVICEEMPELDEEWPVLRAALERRNIDASVEIWSDSAVDWRLFSLVIIKVAAWGYVHRPADFAAWATTIEQQTHLINSAAQVAWNVDKSYLIGLAAAGIATIPTVVVKPGQRLHTEEQEFVIKPTVSAGGFETARYAADEYATAAAHVERLHREGRTAMVQPYQSRIDDEGEAALVYLGGRFSHAIRKGALLQRGVGVIDRLWEREVLSVMEASSAQLALGDRVMRTLDAQVGSTSYARVDVAPAPDGNPVVLEIELIDPSLFLDRVPRSADRFASVLVSQTAAVRWQSAD